MKKTLKKLLQLNSLMVLYREIKKRTNRKKWTMNYSTKEMRENNTEILRGLIILFLLFFVIPFIF